jgi:catechol 2,3-dioxygenase-like lactoylglutathione lyase family enzyme
MSDIPESTHDVMTDLHVIGTKHVCFETENLEQTVDRLKQNGIDFVTKADTAAIGGKYIFLKDCNGILIELYQK